MKTQLEKLAAAAEKAENTINARTWDAHKMNAANVLKDVAAAQVLIDCKENADKLSGEAAEAFTYLYGQFMATFNAKVKKGEKFEASFSVVKTFARRPYIMANAVGRRGFDFAAAVRLAMAAAGNLEKAAKALAWERTTAERQAKAEAEGARKSKNAAKRAARAAAKAEAIRQGMGEENAAKLLATWDAAKVSPAQPAENAEAAN